MIVVPSFSVCGPDVRRAIGAQVTTGEHLHPNVPVVERSCWTRLSAKTGQAAASDSSDAHGEVGFGYVNDRMAGVIDERADRPSSFLALAGIEVLSLTSHEVLPSLGTSAAVGRNISLPSDV